MPRIFDYLDERMQQKVANSEGAVKFTCKGSFLEIYNEKIFDLLSNQSKALNLRYVFYMSSLLTRADIPASVCVRVCCCRCCVC